MRDTAVQARPRRGWATRSTIVLLLLVAVTALAWWARGRGYKTLVLGRLMPESKYAQRHPTVTGTRPADRDSDVPPDAFIACDVSLPNPDKVIDKNTLEGAVFLLRGNARERVPAIVNTTGGGDAIVIHPTQPLAFNAYYTVEVLPALKDTGGNSFEHYTASFSTAAGTNYTEYPAAAETVALPQTQLPETPPPGVAIPPKAMPSYTGVTVGPDHRLYAGTTDGRIIRFEIDLDGTLGEGQTIETIRRSAGNGREPAARLITGVCFDPASTADDLRAWVTHSEPISLKLKDWTGKLSLLTGPNLENCQDYVVGLPRARLDHTTNQCVFGPDGALYFGQASNTAMGAFDPEWGGRGEHLLTACILRLDTKAVQHPPLDVRTDDGGTYDPYAPGAPLTIYATGVRNAYDLLWHSNGQLYAPINGSARGGNVPGTPKDGRFPRRFDQDVQGPYVGPRVVGMRTLPTQNDYLLRVDKGGYYGHPNPARAEYVLNGGNPTGEPDVCQVAQYPPGTHPDRNWRRPAFDFGKNLAPCGVIEYKGDAFPTLKGKILIARYSGGKDVIALTPGPTGEIAEFITGIDGFTHFYDPLDLAEDPATGYLYVAEYGGKRITLLRPIPDGVSKRVIRQQVSPPGAKPPPSTRPPDAPRRPAVASPVP
jgi:glucose/arabinose dehydrogenase